MQPMGLNQTTMAQSSAAQVFEAATAFGAIGIELCDDLKVGSGDRELADDTRKVAVGALRRFYTFNDYREQSVTIDHDMTDPADDLLVSTAFINSEAARLVA